MMIIQSTINTLVRMSNALFVASAVTFGLLCLMNFLIETDFEEPVKADPVIIPSFIQEEIQIEEIIEPPENEIEAPQLPPELPANNSITEVVDFNLNLRPGVDSNLGSEIDIFNPQDGGHVRLVATAPEYPYRALQRSIEGYVDIQFDILKNGTTANVQILDAQPKNLFERSVLKAVARWKYQPKMENGERLAVYGVMERVSFKLTE